MKQTLLISLFSCFFFLSHAQNVVATDSAYSYFSGMGTMLKLDSVRTYQYDSLCRKIACQAYYADKDSLGNIDLKGYRQEQYFYYPNDSLQKILYQSKYITDTAYTDNSRLTYTYTDKGQIATQVYEVQADSVTKAWLTTSVISTAYDAAGNITDNIVQVYDYSLGKLVNNTKSKFEFNSQGQNTVATSLIWGINQQAWVPLYRTLSDYDDNGFLITTTSQFQYNNADVPVWQTESETSYYNNSCGLADSSVGINLLDTGQLYKNYFLYDAVTSELTQSSLYSYFGNELYDVRRIRYIHFLSDNIKADTTINEFLLLPSDSFLVSNQYALTYYYNEDHTVREQVESFDWSDENNYLFYTDRFGYQSCSSALPVSLVSFTGIQKDNNAILKWQTANETNASYFTLQRSADGIHFSALGKVPVSGAASGTKNYMYTDVNIISLSAPGLYYKLVVTDKDGAVSYSKTVKIDIATGKPIVQLSPNPVRNLLTVRSTGAILNAVIAISDMHGRMVYTSKQNIAAGSRLPIDVSGFAKGVYFITLQSAAEKYTFKIVKQ